MASGVGDCASDACKADGFLLGAAAFFCALNGGELEEEKGGGGGGGGGTGVGILGG